MGLIETEVGENVKHDISNNTSNRNGGKPGHNNISCYLPMYSTYSSRCSNSGNSSSDNMCGRYWCSIVSRSKDRYSTGEFFYNLTAHSFDEIHPTWKCSSGNSGIWCNLNPIGNIMHAGWIDASCNQESEDDTHCLLCIIGSVLDRVCCSTRNTKRGESFI